jgi:predicted O-methyltransferase YrrM
MNTLDQPTVTSLLDHLYDDAARVDAPILARVRALPAEERAAIMPDYKRAFSEMKEAYLPIARAAGELLYVLARAKGARRIVEFGTSFGISTVFLASALRDAGGGHLVTTELEPTKAARARANVERAGLSDLVEVRVGDALETLRDLAGPIDFVYLDGAKSLYRPVLGILEPRLAPGALVTADNVLGMAEEAASFTSYVRDARHGYVACTVPLGDGLEVAVRAHTA